ncbi:aminotransferase class V-fold PLP-dependent enzyme [candidate division GN15 bacterium]|nr:aminotransferase class V-fold PLP-dependent enzyme [candidate division GN15 bacterium]
MTHDDFRRHAHQLVDWMADYLEHVRDYPVLPNVQPRDIINQLPDAAPDQAESFDQVVRDFQQLIMPGMTHWQHPSYFAYFPANSSPPSVLAEMLTATLAAQCMIWQTSPAAAELEEQMMVWLREMCGLPTQWTGVIQDTASTATLCSILMAREQYSEHGVNQRGLQGQPRMAVYCSAETHSSIEKAVRIAGLGSEYLRKIPVDDKFALRPDLLLEAIERDKAKGVVPLCAVATIGTTGSTAIDPLRAMGEICREHDVWLHVDAAFAGTAMLLPEMRWMIDGAELADTYVFNPHKWMFTNFDCSAYFVRDPEALKSTFEILPEYLKTERDREVNNYRDWGIPLGRRFRALKLWFVVRSYGVDGLKDKVRHHIGMAQALSREIEAAEDFEMMAPAPLNLLCFRYHPQSTDDDIELDRLNANLLAELNQTGKMFATHTKLDGRYVIRLCIGQTQVTQADVDRAWDLIQRTARG